MSRAEAKTCFLRVWSFPISGLRGLACVRNPRLLPANALEFLSRRAFESLQRRENNTLYENLGCRVQVEFRIIASF